MRSRLAIFVLVACSSAMAMAVGAQPSSRPASGPASAPADRPRIVSVEKIWDAGQHNAFTDLIRFKDRWWCTFRESQAHVGGDGKLRVLTSADGKAWESAALLAERGIDLRDPKLSVTPDGRLMMVAGGSVYQGTTLTGRQPRVAFSADGRQWTPTQRVLEEGQWLWRVTWHKGRAWGTSYRMAIPRGDEDWQLSLYSSPDGVNYQQVAPLDIPGRPNEATLRFLEDDTAVLLVRRERGDQRGWIGTARPPYVTWKWAQTDQRLGGPNFIVLPDGSMWAGSRMHVPAKSSVTVLARMTADAYTPVLTLPSGGDCSYPGMVWHDGLLWMSYYSSHEGKSSIYLARIELPSVRSSAAVRRLLLLDSHVVERVENARLRPGTQGPGESAADRAAALGAALRQPLPERALR